MSKGRLEEIKRAYGYGYKLDVNTYPHWLINRVQELEEVVESMDKQRIKMGESHQETINSIDSVIKQNKRYRESFKTIFNRALDISSYEDLDVHNPELFQFASAVSNESQQALEGES